MDELQRRAMSKKWDDENSKNVRVGRLEIMLASRDYERVVNLSKGIRGLQFIARQTNQDLKVRSGYRKPRKEFFFWVYG